jgi:hypothetical protein
MRSILSRFTVTCFVVLAVSSPPALARDPGGGVTVTLVRWPYT